MEISMDMLDIQSVKQAVGIATMNRAMQQDAQSIASVMDSMQKENSKTMELSVSPNLGSKFDKSI